MEERNKNRPVHYFTQLQQHWRCELRSCHNFGWTCLIYNNRHYKLDSNQLKIWSSEILAGTTTIHTPPLAIHPMPSTKSKKRKLHKHDGYSSEPEESPRGRRWKPSINFHVHQSHSKRPSSYVFTSSPPLSPSEKDENSSSSASMDVGENNNKLSKYISWHVANSPEDAEIFFRALEILKRESCKFGQLAQFTAATWKSLGVPMGIGLDLSNGIKDFEDEGNTQGCFHLK